MLRLCFLTECRILCRCRNDGQQPGMTILGQDSATPKATVALRLLCALCACVEPQQDGTKSETMRIRCGFRDSTGGTRATNRPGKPLNNSTLPRPNMEHATLFWHLTVSESSVPHERRDMASGTHRSCRQERQCSKNISFGAPVQRTISTVECVNAGIGCLTNNQSIANKKQ